MLWQELKQVYGDGIYNYFDALYNYLDFAVLTLYITSFTLRFLTLIKVSIYSKTRDKYKNDHAYCVLCIIMIMVLSFEPHKRKLSSVFETT